MTLKLTSISKGGYQWDDDYQPCFVLNVARFFSKMSGCGRIADPSSCMVTCTRLDEATGQETRMDLSNKELNDQSEYSVR